MSKNILFPSTKQGTPIAPFFLTSSNSGALSRRRRKSLRFAVLSSMLTNYTSSPFSAIVSSAARTSGQFLVPIIFTVILLSSYSMNIESPNEKKR